jgi:hypothetical protein
LFLPIKNNISKDETGLAFTIEGVTILGGIETSRVVWETDSVTVTADEAMRKPDEPEERSSLEDAREFLRNLLADGPVSSKAIPSLPRVVCYWCRKKDFWMNFGMEILVKKKGYAKSRNPLFLLVELNRIELSTS